MSLTRELVRQIRHKPVGDDDRRQASLFVLDTLACALGALKTEPARILGVVAPPRQGDMTRRAAGLSSAVAPDPVMPVAVLTAIADPLGALLPDP